MIQEIKPKKDLTPLMREWNRGKMVKWINDNLTTMPGLDVRYSYAFYDEDKEFQAAANDMPAPQFLQKMYDDHGIRYWSKGVV